MRLSAKKLTQPVSGDQLCGEDIEYDPAFQQLETMLQAKPEQEFGDTVIPGSGPDWKGVGEQALSLLERTRDLRVLSYAAIAQLHTGGLGAFRDALDALNVCLETFWDTIYPKLDVDDGNDATMRFNTLQMLNDRQFVCEAIEHSPLVILKGIGSFSLHDIELAEGKAKAADGEEIQDIAVIQGAFGDASPNDMAKLGAALDGSMGQLKRTAGLWDSLAPDAVALDVDEALKSLNKIHHTLTTYAPVATELVTSEGAVAEGSAEHPGAAPSAPVNSVISNRNDVIKAIDRICEYYVTSEPSSPVPLLLRRAQGLVAKSFYEILEDIAPDSVQQARVIGGQTEE